MNDLRKAAQQALEILDWMEAISPNKPAHDALIVLRAALAQERSDVQPEPTVKESLMVEPPVAENATTQQQIEQTTPPEYSEYRRGYWDGFEIGKREGRIEAEDAQPEPEMHYAARTYQV